GQPYIVFEWIESRSLKALLEAEGQLPLDRALRLLEPVAGALDYAHQRGIIHRDIKPGNILVNSDDQPIIVDFGLAWLASAPSLTAGSPSFGTPYYMSPEQFTGQPLDGRSDLYSLAIVLYEMLAGRPPFDGETTQALYHQHVHVPPPRLTEFNPAISAPVENALRRGLAKNPADRFPTGAAFSEALRVATQYDAALYDSANTTPLGPDLDAPTQMIALPSNGPARASVKDADSTTRLAPPITGGQTTRKKARRRPWWLLGLPLLLCVGLLGGAILFSPTLFGSISIPTLIPTNTQATSLTTNLNTPGPLAPTEIALASPSGLVTATNSSTSTAASASATATAPPTVTNQPPTPSPTPSPSHTPASVSSQTPTATDAPTATRLPTATSAPTPSDTPRPTNTPTQTPTPSPSATATATGTSTPTLTPTTGCALSGEALTISENELSWNVQNNGPAIVTLTTLEASWPDLPPQQRLEAVVWGGITIASPNDNQPPSSLPAEMDWLGTPADRELGPGASTVLQLQFNELLLPIGYSVTLTFDNGCTLAANI
ncbi:MAG: protein kinase domain-containing protein, partial [Anaerolineales bacterium]